MVGAPVGGFPVSQHWQHHSVERRGHQQVLVTDNDGYVNFPRRTVRGSLMLRVLKPIFNILTQGVHVDLGIYACESVVETGLGESTTYGHLFCRGHETDRVSPLFSPSAFFNY